MITILLIESNAIAALDFSTFLEKQGFKVLQARTGEMAVELAKTQIPEIVISNIHLPGMNGYEVLQTIRRNPDTANIRFIFLSTEVCSPFCRRAIQLGANDFLSKPVNDQDLLDAVQHQVK